MKIALIVFLFSAVVPCIRDNSHSGFAEGALTGNLQNENIFGGLASTSKCPKRDCRFFLVFRGFSFHKFDANGDCKSKCVVWKTKQFKNWTCGKCPLECIQAPFNYGNATIQPNLRNQSICYEGHSPNGNMYGSYIAATPKFQLNFTYDALGNLTYVYQQLLPLVHSCSGSQTLFGTSSDIEGSCLNATIDFSGQYIFLFDIEGKFPFTMVCNTVLTAYRVPNKRDLYDGFGNRYGTFKLSRGNVIVTLSYTKQGASSITEFPSYGTTYNELLEDPNTHLGVGVISSKVYGALDAGFNSIQYMIYSKSDDLWIGTSGYSVLDEYPKVSRVCDQSIPAIVQKDCGTFDEYGNGYGNFSGTISNLSTSFNFEYSKKGFQYHLHDVMTPSKACNLEIPIASAALKRNSGLIEFQVNTSSCSFFNVSTIAVEYYSGNWYVPAGTIDSFDDVKRACTVPRPPTDCSTHDTPGNGYGNFSGNLFDPSNNNIGEFLIIYNNSMLVYSISNSTEVCTSQSIGNFGGPVRWGLIPLYLKECSFLGFSAFNRLVYYGGKWTMVLYLFERGGEHIGEVVQRKCL